MSFLIKPDQIDFVLVNNIVVLLNHTVFFMANIVAITKNRLSAAFYFYYPFTSIPIDRQVPSIVFIAVSTEAADMSIIFFSAIFRI